MLEIKIWFSPEFEEAKRRWGKHNIDPYLKKMVHEGSTLIANHMRLACDRYGPVPFTGTLRSSIRYKLRSGGMASSIGIFPEKGASPTQQAVRIYGGAVQTPWRGVPSMDGIYRVAQWVMNAPTSPFKGVDYWTARRIAGAILRKSVHFAQPFMGQVVQPGARGGPEVCLVGPAKDDVIALQDRILQEMATALSPRGRRK